MRSFFIILAFFFGAVAAHAQTQVPQEEVSSMPEEWQLTLDVIKSKAQTLLIKNNGLEDEYRDLDSQARKLQQSTIDQQNQNAQMSRQLTERHGRTEQQMRVDELTQQLAQKRNEARDWERQLQSLTAKKADMDRRIEQLKYTISGLELHQQAEKQKAQQLPPVVQPATADDQLGQLRHQIEDENKHEAELEDQINALKTGDKTQHLNADALNEQNKELEAHLDLLRLQKLKRLQQSSVDVAAGGNQRRYNELKRSKEELEVKINAYEYRLDSLRESSLMSLSWPIRKKKLVHEMVQVDAHNNQMRDQIKTLKEDINILREQVAHQERRLNFAKGKNTN